MGRRGGSARRRRQPPALLDRTDQRQRLEPVQRAPGPRPGRCRPRGRSSPRRPRGATGTASSTCCWRRRQPVAGPRRRARGLDAGAHRPRPTSSRTSAPSVTRVAAPDADAAGARPADGGAGDRAGDPHQRPVEPVRPVGGVEGTAADRGLDDDRAPGERGDQPVAGQEPQPGRRAARAAPRRRRRRPRRCGRSVAGAPRGRPGRRRRPAPPRSAPPRRQRAAVGGLVDAEGRPGHHAEPSRADGGAAISRGDVGAVGRRRPGADHGHRAVQLRRGAAGPAPTAPAATPPRCCSGAARGQVVAARPATRRRRGPRTGCRARPARSRSRSRVEPREPGRDVGAPARARSCSARSRSSRTATAPELGDQRGQPQVARLAEPAQRDPGQPSSSPWRAGHRDPLQRRPAAAGRRCAAAARRRPRPRPGWPDPRRSATVHASRCTRVAPRRLSRPA